jgi:hypothetical protein
MAFDVVNTILGASVANGGTFAVGYPAGKDAGAYVTGVDHRVATNTYGVLTRIAGQVAFSFGSGSITITNNSGQTLAAGTEVFVQLEQPGVEAAGLVASPEKMTLPQLVQIALGAPITADADGVCASQALNAGVDGLINGALAAGGVAVFDQPRNVVAAWTNTAVITVTGTDEYGQVMVESSASGTSFTGAKAFKTVTRVRVSANVTGLTVGSGVVLGLPVFIAGTGSIIRETMDGAAATAGTTVGGVLTTPSATTGDVRGTYNPNSAPNGSRSYLLTVAVNDPMFRGLRQFAG